MSKGSKLFNFVRQNASDHFREVVPEATDSNISDLSNILFAQEYAPTLNEFIDGLVNRIGMTIVHDRSFKNPLAPFKKGSVPLGSDVQEIKTNMLDAEQFTLSEDEAGKLLSIAIPDTKVEYIKRNRKDRYDLSIAYDSLHAAFKSWDDFTRYTDSIFTALYNSAETDEFEKMKELITAAYKNNKVVISQVSAVVDASTAKALLKKARKDYIKMQYPRTEYNAWTKCTGDLRPLKTFTPRNRMVLFVSADVSSEADVEVLAQAFNLDRANWLGSIVQVDQIDPEGKIQAILCDEAFLQVYDNLYRMEEFNNGRVLVRNYYLHVWQIMGVSMLSNAIVYATELPTVNATAVEASASSATVDEGAKVLVPFTVTPPNATTTITASSSAEGTATVTVKGRAVEITGVDAGSATITISAGAGVTDTISVTVTEPASE